MIINRVIKIEIKEASIIRTPALKLVILVLIVTIPEVVFTDYIVVCAGASVRIRLGTNDIAINEQTMQQAGACRVDVTISNAA